MLTKPQLAQILSRIRYKPGWRFKLEEQEYKRRGDGGFILSVTAKTLDADNPTQEAEIHQEQVVYLDMFQDQKQFLLYVKMMIDNAELHEVGEFFTFDGRRIFDPHQQRR